MTKNVSEFLMDVKDSYGPMMLPRDMLIADDVKFRPLLVDNTLFGLSHTVGANRDCLPIKVVEEREDDRPTVQSIREYIRLKLTRRALTFSLD